MGKDSGLSLWSGPMSTSSDGRTRRARARSWCINKSPCRKRSVGSDGVPGSLQAQQEVRVRHLGTVYPVTSPHSFREALGSF